jgi:hypothetical protein
MNIRQTIITGLIFGLAMSIPYCISFGFVQGIITGLITGAFFGLAMYLFIHSKIINGQVQITEDDLFPGEQILWFEPASLVVRPEDFGLKDFAFNQFLWVVGMKKKEVIGGRIYLTNFRIIFKSHRINRLKGMISVFLPAIIDYKNTSFFITQKITIKTFVSKIDFVAGGVDKLVALIKKQKNQLNDSDIQDLNKLVSAFPSKCSQGLIASNTINIINNTFLFGQQSSEKIEYFTDPMGALGGLFIKEFIDKSIAERWEKNFEG